MINKQSTLKTPLNAQCKGFSVSSGERFILLTGDRFVAFFDLAKKQLVKRIQTKVSNWRILFCPCGKRFFVGENDSSGKLLEYRFPDMTLRDEQKYFKTYFSSLIALPKHGRIVASSGDNSLAVFSPYAGLTPVITKVNGWVRDIQTNSDNSLLFLGMNEKTLEVRKFPSLEVSFSHKLKDSVYCVLLSRDEKTVFMGTAGGVFELSIDTRKIVGKFPKTEYGNLWSLAYYFADRFLSYVCKGQVHVVDLFTKTVVHLLKVTTSESLKAVRLPQKNLLVVAGDDKDVSLYQTFAVISCRQRLSLIRQSHSRARAPHSKSIGNSQCTSLCPMIF